MPASLEKRLAVLEATVKLSHQTHIIWQNEGDTPEQARKLYLGQIKPSDRVVLIGWEPPHETHTEIPPIDDGHIEITPPERESA